jgi:hypothetical protein
MMTTPSEQLGRVAGWLSAPVFAAAAALRRSRVFHPAGELFEGVIEAGAPPDDFAPLAIALRGRALVRFSGALWKSIDTRRPDVLGCAVRLQDPRRGNQDLLFATIRRPWSMGFAPLTTHVDDYLANHYFGVSPFVLEEVPRRFYLRLRPRRKSVDGGVDRSERLLRTLDEGPVEIAIDASYRPRAEWREIAVLRIERLAAADDARLRFDPFSTGRGIRPRGVIHALRHGAYAASQATRRAFE